MAILQEVDKCVRCNGCVISCKRTWHMKGIVGKDVPHQKLDPNQRVVIKSQKRVDNGPFVRFSCWHCKGAPCTTRCPFKAIKKNASTGAVWIDPRLCNPGATNSAGVQCVGQCKVDCQRGGVPMIGSGSDDYTDHDRSWKCTLCTGMDENHVQFGPYKGAGAGGDLPTKVPGTLNNRFSELLGRVAPGTLPDSAAIPELDHQPTCVYTCPAKAMVYDTRANILAYLRDSSQGWTSAFGDGSMFWASKKFTVAPPKADPFVEDHLTPMVSSVLSSPFAKAALAPTLVAAGVLAVVARRAKMEDELSMTGEER